MRKMVERYQHRTGEHCASTALRNILGFHGTDLSEPMVFGLSSGLGFYYFCADAMSPTRMFHGRAESLEQAFFRHVAIPFEEPTESDDERAWLAVRARIDAGEPVLVSTDTFYLGYHQTTSHFPGHRAVVVGYDDDAREVYIADRKFSDYQTCSYDELRRSRNADDYAVPCQNRYGDLRGPAKPGRPHGEAVRRAIRETCNTLLGGDPQRPEQSGIPAMKALAADFPTWGEAPDWSWASRFGYQVIIKRGAGGSFFRSLYADFLAEAADAIPALHAGRFSERMHTIAGHWRDLAAVLESQSDRSREVPDPALFERAGELTAALADEEGGFFRDLGAHV